MSRTLAIVGVTLLASMPSLQAARALEIPPNTWIQQPPPTVSLLPGRTGEFSGRGWNKMHYDAVTGKMILFDGYAELPVYPYENILANSIWSYDPMENRLSLEKVGNWTFGEDGSHPLPENESDPTPFDRHVYSCSAYSASMNRFYMWAGANRTMQVDTAEVWTYDLGARAWRQIMTEAPYNIFEQACSYDPFLEKVVLFSGAERPYGLGDKTWVFDLATETWTNSDTYPAPTPRMGQAMCFDLARGITWMFSGADWGSAGNELWHYAIASNQWTQITSTPPWPPARRFPNLAYDANHDLILMWGGINASDQPLEDTWLFHPSNQTWEEVAPVANPTGRLKYYSEDLEYDPVNDVFVLNLGGVFWLYRPLTITSVPSDGASSAAMFRITSRNPGPDGATLEFSLPRTSTIRIDVFDLAGHRIKTLANGSFGPGTHVVRWAGQSSSGSMASGLYLARLVLPHGVLTRKIILVR